MITSLPVRPPAAALVDVRRLADTRSPAEVIRSLRATPGLVVLHGEWAGGSTIITAHPSATLTDADGIRAACSEPLPSPPASSAIGGGWFGWLRYPDSPSGPRTEDGPGAGDYLGYYPSLLRYRPDVGCWYDEALVSDSSLDARRRDLRLLLRQPSRAAGSAYRVGPMRLRQSRAGYTASVNECIEQIRAGRVYQANLCFRMDTDFGGDGAALFADLVDTLQPAFGALICTSTQAVVSVSPELFLRRRGNTVTSAPIKGTRPKSSTGRDPDPAATELLRSTKERAENVMIVDLVRNDLGRVAATGTVRVPSTAGRGGALRGMALGQSSAGPACRWLHGRRPAGRDLSTGIGDRRPQAGGARAHRCARAPATRGLHGRDRLPQPISRTRAERRHPHGGDQLPRRRAAPAVAGRGRRHHRWFGAGR